MKRQINRLTATQVRNATKDVCDGYGLWLQVSPKFGTKSWLYRFTCPVTGKADSMGLGPLATTSLEHWKRLWALSRRLGTPGSGDEYDNLKPVADLRKQLQDRLYVFLQNPLRWEPAEPADDAEKQQVFDGLANALSAKTLDLVARRVRADRMADWQTAFNQSGRGSSFTRATIIGNQIYDRAAPIPDMTPSPDRNAFLHEVAALVDSVCAEGGAALA